MSKGIVIDCMFWDSTSGYTCYVQNECLITSIDDQIITGIRGEHLEGKTNDDVTHFYAEAKIIKFFPQNLTKYFKNIKIITIINGKLQKITKEDLKEFGDKLEDLNLNDNEVEVLKADLFELNRNLELIFLRSNKIKKIEAKTFDGLENLVSLWLNKNPCTLKNDKADFNRQKVLELIKRVEANCIYPLNAEKLEEISPFNSKTFEALNESNKKFESLKLENEKLEAKLSTQSEIRLRNKENEEFKMESLKKILEKEKEILKLEEKVKKLKENEDFKAFMTEVIQGQEEKLKNFIEAQISSKLNLQATKISSLEDKIEKMNHLTSKSTNEVKNLIEGQISVFDAKMAMQTSKIIEDTKNAFNELKKDQKIFADAQETTLKLELEKITKDQSELKSLIESQTTKVSLLEEKIEKEVLKLSSDSKKAFDEFKSNQENILKRINENLKDATLKSQNEVKNLIENQALTLDIKINSNLVKLTKELDFTPKFKELREKIEEITSKVSEDSEKDFDKFEKYQKIFTDAQNKILNTNMEKFNENLKNHNAELQESFKELKLKNPIDTQTADHMSSSLIDKQNETLKLAEKINQILSKALDGTNKSSEEFEALSKKLFDTLRKFGARVNNLTSELGNKIENNKSKE